MFEEMAKRWYSEMPELVDYSKNRQNNLKPFAKILQ